LYLELLDGRMVRKCIEDSYRLVVSKLSKRVREKYDIEALTSE
jgi:predicted DNA-binding protein (MmcQ/YjbR family)